MEEIEKFLVGIPFNRNARPVAPADLGSKPEVTNCQRAVQAFYYRYFNFSLEPELVLSTSILRSDQYVIKPTQVVEKFFTGLQCGDLVYAERLRDKDRCFIYKDRSTFPDEYAWAKSLHLAIYLGTPEQSTQLKALFPSLRNWGHDKSVIYHANGVSRVSCFWTIDKFKWYYLPVAAKRVII